MRKSFSEVSLGSRIQDESDPSLKKLFSRYLSGNFDGTNEMLYFFENSLSEELQKEMAVRQPSDPHRYKEDRLSEVRERIKSNLLGEIKMLIKKLDPEHQRQAIEKLEVLGIAIDSQSRHVKDTQELVDESRQILRRFGETLDSVCFPNLIPQNAQSINEHWQISEFIRMKKALKRGKWPEKKKYSEVQDADIRNIIDDIRNSLNKK